MKKNIYINTLGCAKNEVDSAKMAKKLKNAGYHLVNDFRQSDLIIVNTCSFIEAATSESIDTIFDFLNASKKKDAKVLVAGCMPERYAADLAESLPEVAGFVPCSKEDEIVKIVSDLIGGADDLHPSVKSNCEKGARLVSTYVKISEGCDRACAFCTIPKIRGAYRSFSKDQIFEDVKEAVSAGAREINLVAQDTGHWGRDKKDGETLSSLLDFLACEFSETWFRVLYVQPDEVTDDLIETIAKHENVLNYLDIPFQHSSNDVLRAMNRCGGGSSFTEKIAHIRDVLPNCVIRTTLMVGFPGETDQDFEEMLEFASAADLDYIGVFEYSDEDIAPSSKFADKVDDEEKKYRFDELVDVVNNVTSAKLAAKIGQRCKVLVEGKEADGQVFGRAWFQAPEVDGVVYLDKGESGDVVDVKFEDTLMFDLEGRVVV